MYASRNYFSYDSFNVININLFIGSKSACVALLFFEFEIKLL